VLAEEYGHNIKSNGVMPINIQLEPLFEDKKKEQNVLKLFLLAFTVKIVFCRALSW
jgi:hypothetical protein